MDLNSRIREDDIMKEEVEKVEIKSKFRPKNTVGFGVNDIPIWFYKELETVCKERFNDQRWVMLLDFYRKAQAYELVLGGIAPPTKEEYKQEDDTKKPVEIITMGGVVRKNAKDDK
jgi:hypothetical protein